MVYARCRIATWNIAWKAPKSKAGREMRRRLDGASPDVICLTEGYRASLPADGHIVESGEDYGYPLKPARRKVLLWSRNPWREIDTAGTPTMPAGRLVSAVTSTSLGPLRVVGVCIPWSHAHVNWGRRDRKPWEDHLAYLEALAEILSAVAGSGNAVIVGDFNQRVPRVRVPQPVHDRLLRTIGSDFEFATRGIIPTVGKQSVDHVAHSRGLRALAVDGISNVGAAGEELSDHFGLVVDLAKDA